MTLADDLLLQVQHLALVDQRRPKQASLRRAVSTAYCALFHLLIAAFVRRIAPACPVGLQARVGRALSHSEMREVCGTVIRKDHGPVLAGLLPSGFSPEMRSVAEAFINLQDDRHRADYDLSVSYTRPEVLNLLQQASEAFRAWAVVESNEEAVVFLSAMLFARRWGR